jgi:tetratricopeptide (TPR) repeat protein
VTGGTRLAAVVLAVTAASCGGPSPEEEQAAAFLRAGAALEAGGAAWAAGERGRAATLYAEALRERPAASGDAYARLAEVLESEGLPDEALVWLQRGCAQVPGHPPLLLRLGACHERAGRLAAALECYEEARVRLPGDPAAWAAVERVRAAIDARKRPS